MLIHGTGPHCTPGKLGQKSCAKTIVLFADLPAYGLTGADPEKRYSSKDYVDLIDTFLTQLGVEKFHLGGNSLGGLVACIHFLSR